MSTSTLPLFPLPSTSNPEAFLKQATKRTYGRQRPPSPPRDDQPLPSLFRPLEDTHISPAKGLLNRWSGVSTSWRDSLAFLDASKGEDDDADVAREELERRRKDARAGMLPFSRAKTPEEQEDTEVNLEEARREMERMRREARGEAVARSVATASTSRLEPPGTKVNISFSSSSLTAPSTSPPPSSPPRLKVKPTLRPESSIDEETMPVRKSGMTKASGRTRRVIASSDEKESDEELAVAFVKPTRPPRLSSYSDEERERTSRRTRSPHRNLSIAVEQERDETAESGDDSPVDKVQMFLSTLADDDQVEEKERERSTESINDSAGLFEGDEAETGTTVKATKGGKALKVKHITCRVIWSDRKQSLNLKEMADMRKDIARAQRGERLPKASRRVFDRLAERPIAIPKPEVTRLPITSWLALAGQAIHLAEPR